MKIVTVIPLEKTAFSGVLTYFSSKDIALGSIVSVSIRNKKILALAVSTEEASDIKGNIKGMDFNLRKIIDIKENSIFRPELISSAFLTADYFGTNKNSVLSTLIPAILKTEYDKLPRIKIFPDRDFSSQNIRSEKLILQISKKERISVYKTLIRENFAAKKSVFIVLPTEEDVKDYLEILGKGIGQFAFGLSSGHSPKKILASVKEIMVQEHPILIVATAPFLSIPRYDLGVIILEHESSNAYKTIKRPHLDLRVFAEIFASKIGVKFIMSDTMLRFETIGRIDTDNLTPMHPLSYRVDIENNLSILDKGEKFKVLDDAAVEAIKTAISEKKNVFVFALRKGLATMTVCRDCGQIVGCDNCGSPVVLYLSKDGKKRMFICNKCKREMRNDTHCVSCGSWNLMPLGIGTDTVAQAIKASIPKANIFKLDKETAKTAKGAEKIVKDFDKEAGAILVGTEMALFYIKNKIPLTIIASFETLWGIPNFKMSEKIIQLVLSMAGKTKEKFIIQTKNINDPAILALQSGNLLQFVRGELDDRKALGYPPFKRFIKITHTGDKAESLKVREALSEVFSEYEPEIFSGFVGKIKNKYITNALIKINPVRWSLPELSPGGSIDANLLAKIANLPSIFEIFVDPEDLL
jgi:primosomal protein N'